MNFQSLVLKMDMAAAQARNSAESELKDLLFQYAEACNQINTRLFSCFSYLRGGFRSEALRLAEMEPPVLESFGSLRYFQSRDWWLEYAAYVGIQISELAESFACEIQEAYDESEKTRRWTDELRLLNAHRRPVAERRKVLQKLAELEPNSPLWKDGLAALSDS